MTDHIKIHESGYGKSPLNFDITKSGDELLVDLTYPPKVGDENTAEQCRYIVFDQESVRASDGIRLHYDYDRDGYVVEQPKHRLVKLEGKSYDTVTDWIEVGFFGAWKFEEGDESFPTAADFERADQEYATRAKA